MAFFCFSLLFCGLFLYYHKYDLFLQIENLQQLMRVEGNVFWEVDMNTWQIITLIVASKSR